MDDPIPDSTRAEVFYGVEHLRRLRTLSRSLLDNQSAELVLAFIGDSWVRGSGLPAQGDPARVRYFMPDLCAALQQRYGDAGGGWCGLSYTTSTERRGGSANSNRLYQAGVGAWTTRINNRPVPDLCSSASRVRGDCIRVTNTLGPTSEVSLYYLPGGVLEYRWKGGTWTRLALDHTRTQTRLRDVPQGPQVAPLHGFPQQGAWTLDLRVVSGMVELAGIEHRTGLPGIRIHNLGAGGSNARQWSEVDAHAWAQGFSALACDTALVLLGTNDQKHITHAVHQQSLRLLVGMLKQATPAIDIGLCTSPESGDIRDQRIERPMRLYAMAARALAREQALAYVDLQAAFGSPDRYRYGGAQPLLDASLIHPNEHGSRVLKAVYLQLFESLGDGSI